MDHLLSKEFSKLHVTSGVYLRLFDGLIIEEIFLPLSSVKEKTESQGSVFL